jgi:hypothetical protein
MDKKLLRPCMLFDNVTELLTCYPFPIYQIKSKILII